MVDHVTQFSSSAFAFFSSHVIWDATVRWFSLSWRCIQTATWMKICPRLSKNCFLAGWTLCVFAHLSGYALWTLLRLVEWDPAFEVTKDIFFVELIEVINLTNPTPWGKTTFPYHCPGTIFRLLFKRLAWIRNNIGFIAYEVWGGHYCR